MIADLIVAALIVLGGLFTLIGSFGLLKLPSLMARLHAPTKATTLGVGSCLVASLIYFPTHGGGFTAHELLISLFLFITAPVSANMIAKAHLHRQVHRVAGETIEDVPEILPLPGEGTGWATFWCPPAAEGDPSRQDRSPGA